MFHEHEPAGRAGQRRAWHVRPCCTQMRGLAPFYRCVHVPAPPRPAATGARLASPSSFAG